jgi:hypothetical protein
MQDARWLPQAPLAYSLFREREGVAAIIPILKSPVNERCSMTQPNFDPYPSFLTLPVGVQPVIDLGSTVRESQIQGK